MLIFSWVITLLVVVLLVSFLFDVLSLRRLPTEQRPCTRTYDRFGKVIAVQRNPDYRVNPGEGSAKDSTA